MNFYGGEVPVERKIEDSGTFHEPFELVEQTGMGVGAQICEENL